MKVKGWKSAFVCIKSYVIFSEIKGISMYFKGIFIILETIQNVIIVSRRKISFVEVLLT